MVLFEYCAVELCVLSDAAQSKGREPDPGTLLRGGARAEEGRARGGVSGWDWAGVDERGCGRSAEAGLAEMAGPCEEASAGAHFSPPWRGTAEARGAGQTRRALHERLSRRRGTAEAGGAGQTRRALHERLAATHDWRGRGGRGMGTKLGATATPSRKRMHECKQAARQEMRALTRAGIEPHGLPSHCSG